MSRRWTIRPREAFRRGLSFAVADAHGRIRLRVEADEATQVPSITSISRFADWFERECYDLYGVIFTGHPISAAVDRLRL